MNNKLTGLRKPSQRTTTGAALVDNHSNTIFMSVALGATAATVLIFFAYLIWSML